MGNEELSVGILVLEHVLALGKALMTHIAPVFLFLKVYSSIVAYKRKLRTEGLPTLVVQAVEFTLPILF